jgi:hypothetical protein
MSDFIQITVQPPRRRGRPRHRRWAEVRLRGGVRLRFADAVPHRLLESLVQAVMTATDASVGSPC